jgi:MFS family permease
MALGIFAVHWALTGAFVTSMGFTLREDPFVCPHEPLEAACKEYVCGLPWQQWHTFI